MVSLELQQRTFTSEFVKGCAASLYQKKILPATWNRWRQWVYMPKGVQTYSWTQLCELCGIALIRNRDGRLGHSTTRELCRSEIELVGKSLELQECLASVVLRMDAAGRIAGKDAERVLGVSRATLYRKVPNFQSGKVYSIEYLRRWVNAS